jgi:hypothetical protein
MWIPLRPIEEERDPEKAQKLEEMIVILRKVSTLSLLRAGAEQLGRAQVRQAMRHRFLFIRSHHHIHRRHSRRGHR